MPVVKFKTVQVPSRKSFDPLVWRLLTVMKLKQQTPRKIGPVSGVDHKTITSWFSKKRSPTLMNFRAVANSLGYEVVLIPKEEADPYFGPIKNKNQ